MNSQAKSIIERLRSVVDSSSFIELSYQIVDDLEMLSEPHEAVEPIIRLMEDHPDVEYGNPGPLAHFMEQFDEERYDLIVLESVKRKPSKHMVFLFNRIINSVDEVQRQRYLNVLKGIALDENGDAEVWSFANELLAYHRRDENQFITELERCDVVLVHPLNTSNELLTLKGALGLNGSTAELLKLSKNVPCTLIESVPIGKAKKMLSTVTGLESFVELKPRK